MSNTQLAPLPVSNATNLYELFQDVYKAIQDEPARFCMNDIITASNGVVDPLASGRWINVVTERMPACGTVGCYGGWCMVLLGSGQRDYYGIIRDLVRQPDGWCNRDLSDLLDGLFGAVSAFIGLRYGTPEYTEKALMILKTFMDQHEEMLLACLV